MSTFDQKKKSEWAVWEELGIEADGEYKKNKSANSYISAVVAKNHCYTSHDCCCTFLAFPFGPIKSRLFIFFLRTRMWSHVNVNPC